MDAFHYDVVIPAKSVNFTIKHATDFQHVGLRFLKEHWHEVKSVAWNTRLLIKDDEDVEAVARNVAEVAVENDMLHHSLVEHAVLHTQVELKYNSANVIDESAETRDLVRHVSGD